MKVFSGSYKYNIDEYNRYINKCKKNKIIKEYNNKYIYKTINNIININDITDIIYNYYYIDYFILPIIPSCLSININFVCFMSNSHPIEKIIIDWFNEKMKVVLNILNIYNIKYIVKDRVSIIFNKKYLLSFLNCDKNLCIISSSKFYKIKNTIELINIIKKII